VSVSNYSSLGGPPTMTGLVLLDELRGKLAGVRLETS
jgi:hypothetical protein